MTKPRSKKHTQRVLAVDGEAVRRHRMKMGWSQEQLGRLAEMSTRTISKIEAGSQVYVGTLTRVANVLQVNQALLMKMNALQPQSAAGANEVGPDILEGASETIRLVVTVPLGDGRTPLKHIVSVLRGLGCRVVKARSQAGD